MAPEVRRGGLMTGPRVEPTPPDRKQPDYSFKG